MTTTFEALSAAGASEGDDFMDTGNYSDALLTSLAIIPKCTSVLSMAGSLWIVLEVLSDKEKQKLVYHRLLFGFSTMDLISSVGLFLTTWPMPRGTEDVIGAVGTIATCEMQGFLVQLGIVLPIYNAMLSFYYVLVIQYNVSETRVQKRYEAFFHGIPIVFGVSTAIAALCLNMYNEANLWCWIAAHPDGCLHTKELDNNNDNDDNNSSSVPPPTTTTCERGDGAFMWRWGAYYAPIWLCFFIVLGCLLMVWRGVRRQEIKTERFQRHRSTFTVTAAARSTAAAAAADSQHTPERNGTTAAGDGEADTRQSSFPRRTLSRVGRRLSSMTRNSTLSAAANQSPRRSWQVLTQCLCYVMAFYLCYLFGSIVRIQQAVSGKTDLVLLLIHCFFLPLQGLFNFLIYRRPCYLRLRRKHPINSRWWVLKKCLEIKLSQKRTQHDDGSTGCRRCWCSCWKVLRRGPQFTRGGSGAVSTPAPAVVSSSLSERLDQIRSSDKLTSRQRQLATLEETDVIAATKSIVHFSLPEEEDEVAEQVIVIVETIEE
mmetsp:Transcript_492/g.808  ORF Transcript_492/g.808 Transcript_492/m.808 type:complete len:542 (-) Transcript_492:113-1738(-)|eukprot:CAMPEP_0119022372 /NCGR_PEP_ID=MMETSP1176-20130426/27857_1 /TAXON_ID=265551 /ORGANISM="Synedropsis recta cf, Strain CCMP1620" /LENGTH=541 /DNA_ID=CAMNT_0006977205 /DNA_START=202 /DNA_END=1827 /DNA_ORIENTATION=+